MKFESLQNLFRDIFGKKDEYQQQNLKDAETKPRSVNHDQSAPKDSDDNN